MSNEEAEEYVDSIVKRWEAKQKRNFIGRMERKLHQKERDSRS
jgi:hypothetical protein